MSWSDYWNTAKSWFGYQPHQKVGKDLGRYLGQLGQEYIPIPGVNGSQFGEWVGSFLPFKEGGIVESKRDFDRWAERSGLAAGMRTESGRMLSDAFRQYGLAQLKNGGRIPPLSFSNVRAQMMDEASRA